MSDGAWVGLLEELLRGVTHAINNRITALSAFAELSAMDGQPVETAVLRREIGRLHEVSALVSAMATRGAGVEALEVGLVIDQALAIYAHHPQQTRPMTYVFDRDGTVLPVRVPRYALLRVVLLFLDAARRTPDANVVLRVSGTPSVTSVEARALEHPGADAIALATACGGTISWSDGTARLELPSLLELRRRERSG